MLLHGASICEEQGSAQKKCILYVEDNAKLRWLVAEILSYEGYRVLTTGNGLSGLELAINEQPDLILMDLGLPGINGVDATLRLRMSHGLACVPIVALTAGMLDEGCERFFAAGGSGCLFK